MAVMTNPFTPTNNTGINGGNTGILSNAYSNYMPQTGSYPSSNIFVQNAAMGRTPTGGTFGAPVGGGGSDPLTGSYNLYNKAVEQQAGDYGNIMKNYQDLLNKANSFTSGYNPATATYQQSPDLTDAISKLKGLSETGGYSDQDIQNLRERGISPIRSVYASAQRNVDRNRALQGGFSPNYNAVTAKMARELSDQIANQVTNVNAGIAQNVAQNKLNITPQYAGTTAGQSNLANEMGSQNADRVNQAKQFGMQIPFQYASDALHGMTSLYGTTPAMSSLFGNQALQAASLQNQINQEGQRNTNQAISSFMPGIRLG
jgi:hypothetical protein